MRITDEIGPRLSDFKELCEAHSVKSLFAFGSVVQDSFDPISSDIDLLVEIDEPDPIARGEKLIALWDSLEVFFNKRIDLLTDSSIRNPILRKNINDTKKLIYDVAGKKVLV